MLLKGDFTEGEVGERMELKATCHLHNSSCGWREVEAGAASHYWTGAHKKCHEVSQAQTELGGVGLYETPATCPQRRKPLSPCPVVRSNLGIFKLMGSGKECTATCGGAHVAWVTLSFSRGSSSTTFPLVRSHDSTQCFHPAFVAVSLPPFCATLCIAFSTRIKVKISCIKELL